MPITRVTDLKIFCRSEHPPVTQQEDVNHVHRQTRFLSGHGLHAIAHLSPLRYKISRRLQSKEVHLPRSIPLHGVCANHLSRKFARYRNLPACPGSETLPHGHSQQSVPINHRRRQRTEKLANLCRSGLFADPHGTQALQRRILRFRVGTNSLCARRYNNRPVPVHVSMGQLPKEQGSRQTPYVTRFTLQHPDLHSHLRRQTPRSQYTRHRSLRTGIILRHGSRISGLFQIVQPFAGLSLLSNPCQIESPVPKNLLASGGSLNRPDLRPDNHAHRILSEQRLSRETATRKISRRRNRSYHCSDDQQFQTASHNRRRALSLTLAGGTLFQMDQTTPAHQELLRYFRERGQNTNLDRDLRLRHCGYPEKTAHAPLQSLQYFTDSQCLCFRKNSTLSTICKNQLQSGKPYVV